MNIVFMGTPDYCIPSLEELYKNYNVQAVVTQPDKAADRGQKVLDTPVKRFALRNKIEVLQPERIRKDKGVYERLVELSPDIIIVIAYGQIIPRSILDIPRLGCVNIHGSLLPSYRGASPIQAALRDGLEVTGVTSMMMNEKMDEGDILIKIECPVDIKDNAGILHDKLSQISARCTVETIEGLRKGIISPEAQDHSQATYTKLISKEDGKIDWGKSACEIYNCYRAMTPWPSAYTFLDGEYIKILSLIVNETESLNEKPGRIMCVKKDFFTVACGKGSVNIDRLQIAGRKNLSFREFSNGNSIIDQNTEFEF